MTQEQTANRYRTHILCPKGDLEEGIVSKMAGPRVTVDPGTSLCSFPASSILLGHLHCPGNVNPKDRRRTTTDTYHHGQINLIKASFFFNSVHRLPPAKMGSRDQYQM